MACWDFCGELVGERHEDRRRVAVGRCQPLDPGRVPVGPLDGSRYAHGRLYPDCVELNRDCSRDPRLRSGLGPDLELERPLRARLAQQRARLGDLRAPGDGATGSSSSERVPTTSPPSAAASAPRSSASESARRTFSSESGQFDGLRRSTASASEGTASAGVEASGRSSSERSASPAAICPWSASAAARRVTEMCAAAPGLPPSVMLVPVARVRSISEERVLGHAVAARRLLGQQARHGPVRRAALDRARDRHREPRQEARDRSA